MAAYPKDPSQWRVLTDPRSYVPMRSVRRMVNAPPKPVRLAGFQYTQAEIDRMREREIAGLL